MSPQINLTAIIVTILVGLILFFWQRYVNKNDALAAEVLKGEFQRINKRLDDSDKKQDQILAKLDEKKPSKECEKEMNVFKHSMEVCNSSTATALKKKLNERDCIDEMNRLEKESGERREQCTKTLDAVRKALINHTHNPGGGFNYGELI